MKNIRKFSAIPVEGTADWLGNAIESVAYLQSRLLSDWVPLYVSMPNFWFHAILMPAGKVNPVDQAALGNAHLDASRGWALEHSWTSMSESLYLDPPLGSGNVFDGAHQLVYRRRMEGVPSRRNYTELDQRLTQALGLHFMEERNAYCIVNEQGDIEPVIRIEDIAADERGDSGHVVEIKAEALARYMAVTGMALVGKFDFTRVDHRGIGFPGWDRAERFDLSTPDLFYHGGVAAGACSYVNGWIVSRPSVTVEQVMEQENEKSDRSKRRHADFIIQDFRHERIVEWSASPTRTTNYFDVTEGLPFELSPVFFKPAVLAKYKADQEKYQIDGRSIRCRGGWELRSFDINEAGQVHTYLQDLSFLPYEEQLYWKSFNEEPRAPVSKRSFDSDFKGEWTDRIDPLDSIKHRAASLDRSPPAWWSERGEPVLLAAQYPSLENASEWGDELMHLDQLVVEGFKLSGLRGIASRRGIAIETNWKSLKLIECILVAAGRTVDEAKEVIAPFQRLHALRNVLTAHTAGSAKAEERAAAIRQYKTYRAHFEQLAARIDAGMEIIAAVLSEH